MDRDDLNALRLIVVEICGAAVDAVFRYYDLTDWDPKYVPESFIECYALDKLGEKYSLNSQISFQDLYRYNSGEQAPPGLSKERVDLVINRQNSPNKQEQHVWAIVELKRDDKKVGEDRSKLTSKILPTLTNCPFGVAIGITEISSSNSWLDEEARKEGSLFVQSEPKSHDVRGEKRTFVGFAYLHENVATTLIHGSG